MRKMVVGGVVSNLVGDPVFTGSLTRNVLTDYGYESYIYVVDTVLDAFSSFLEENGVGYFGGSPVNISNILQSEAAVFAYIDNGLDDMGDVSGGILLDKATSVTTYLKRGMGFAESFFREGLIKRNNFNSGRFHNAN